MVQCICIEKTDGAHFCLAMQIALYLFSKTMFDKIPKQVLLAWRHNVVMLFATNRLIDFFVVFSVFEYYNSRMFGRCMKSCRCCGFTLIELIIASGIVSVLTVMISVIVCNVSKVVSLQKEIKAIEGNIILNDICVWINNLDDIIFSERTDAKKLNNHIYFEIDKNAKSSLSFLSYNNDNLAEIFFVNGKVGITWDYVLGKDVNLNKYIILSDNVKDAYLRPIYTEDGRDVENWNNTQKMSLNYNNVKKLQELKKEDKIASVHLVVENGKLKETQSFHKKKF